MERCNVDYSSTNLDVRENQISTKKKILLHWIFISSKLSQCKAKLESTILSTCQSIGSNIAEQTRQFVEHVHLLK